MILVPPRHGKSTLATKAFPAWFLGRNPNKKIITVSYGAELATEFGREVRNMVDSEQYQDLFPIQLRKDSKAANRWNTDNGGAYIATGIDGPVTGKGGDIIIVDDPHKNRKEADSRTMSDGVHNYYQSTLYSRQQPGGNTAIVVIMQRWNTYDLAARLLELAKTDPDADQWEVVEMAAVHDGNGNAVEIDDARAKALCPEMFNLPALRSIKVNSGTRNWTSQWQQQPTVDGGEIIKTEFFRYWTAIPGEGVLVKLPQHFDEVIQSWDLAFKGAEESSMVVGQVWGFKGADMFLIDESRKIRSFVETLRAFEALTLKWPIAMRKLVEDKANGPALESVLRNKIPGIILEGVDGDKTARLWAVTPPIESYNVYLPSPAQPGYNWVHDWLQEVGNAPNGVYNDRPDAMAQAIKYRLGRGRSVLTMLTKK
jgi:predicted phage terminase large subunit-like protein